VIFARVEFEPVADADTDGRHKIVSKALDIPPDRQTAEHGKRLGQEMRKLGWRGPMALWIGGRTASRPSHSN
jgi:hypothetical protein